MPTFRAISQGGVQSLHDTHIGFRVALLQFNSMQLGVQLAYANFSGLLERSGSSRALDGTFFPGKPVGVFRCGLLAFGRDSIPA